MKAAWPVAIALVGLAGLAHPADLVAAGGLAGSGAVVSALISRHRASEEKTALVADWLGAKAHDDESVVDVAARFSGTRIAEIAQQRRAYLHDQGREAERSAEHERRSQAARRAAATRRAGIR